ncbi:MAG: sulfatase-like hydrolase/transferase [Desulfobacteraceae bacterium]|nr:sulfatase-like hydrolase/transferase [Desulfobacteraceae bacterium]
MNEGKREAKGSCLSRRQFLKSAGVGALSVGLGSTLLANGSRAETRAGSEKSSSFGNGGTGGPYNILFVLTDQERYFDEYPPGLNLPGRERLKRMGVSFENHYTCSNVCTPSRSVIYTGQHMPNTAMFDNSNMPWQPDLSTDIPTVGDMLRRAGYYTAYKGKWHLSKSLERKGREKLFTEAMEPYGFSDYNWLGDDYGHELGGHHLDQLFAGTAINWIRTKGVELRQKQQPWFLAVNLINPHDIMYFNTDVPGKNDQDNGRLLMKIGRAPDFALYKRSWDVPLPKNLFQSMTEPGRPRAHEEYTKIYDIGLGHIPMKRENWKRYQGYYLNCLREVDIQIERLIKELEDQDLLKNTIIVFTADHGEMCGAHGMRGKGNFAYEEIIHLPLLMVHPEIRGDQQCQALTSHVDLAPTFVGLTEIDEAQKKAITKDLPGKDLSPLMKRPKNQTIDAVRSSALYAVSMLSCEDSDIYKKVSDYLAAGKDPAKLEDQGLKPDLRKRGFLRTIFDGRYKFSRYFSPLHHNKPQTLTQILQHNDLELFDLKNDPHEMHNLAMDTSKNKKLILAMNEKLNHTIEQEIGEDRGQYMPGGPDRNWAVTTFDP